MNLILCIVVAVVLLMPPGSSKKLLRRISGIGGVSDSVLSRVLGIVKDEPELLDGCRSRQSLSRAARSVAAEIGTERHTIVTNDGSTYEWETFKLQELLPFLCRECSHLRAALQTVFLEKGHAWKLVLYSDGITPGSVLVTDNRRKTVVWYCSILECRERLCHEEMWFCVAAIRTGLVKNVPGGFSALTKLIMKEMFAGDDALDAGLNLPVGPGGRLERVRISFGCMLGDEDALSAMLGLKGSSGTVPCAMRCWCVAKPRALDLDNGILPLQDRDIDIVDITCSRKADIIFKCDADIWADVDHLLQHANLPHFAEKQQCIGINFHPEHLLFDLEMRRVLQPSSTHRYDVQHVIFSNGVLPRELMGFLNAAKEKCGIYFADVREYMKRWKWQGPGHSKPEQVFNETRESSSSDSLKAGASEIYSICPLFRHFAIDVFHDTPCMALHLLSLLLLLDVVDLVRSASKACANQITAIAVKLDRAVFKYLEAFKRCYGYAACIPKHHMLIHIASQILADLFLLWCFVVERKHIMVKKQFENDKRQRKFETSALSRIQVDQMRQLAKPGWLSSLGAATDFPELQASLGAASCRISKTMRWHETDVRSGYAVFIGADLANLVLVVCCVAAASDFALLVQQCDRRRGDAHSSYWIVAPDIKYKALARGDQLRVAQFWRYASCGSLMVLH